MRRLSPISSSPRSPTTPTSLLTNDSNSNSILAGHGPDDAHDVAHQLSPISPSVGDHTAASAATISTAESAGAATKSEPQQQQQQQPQHYPDGPLIGMMKQANKNFNSSRSSKRELPPLFWYMELGDWEKAAERVRKHPKEAKTWATLRTKQGSASGLSEESFASSSSQGNNNSMSSLTHGGGKHGSAAAAAAAGGSKVTSTKRLALHHACFKLRSAGSAPVTTTNLEEDPYVVVCKFILMLIRVYPEAAGQRETRHGCLPLHLAAFASCAPRSAGEQDAENPQQPQNMQSATLKNNKPDEKGNMLRPGLISRRVASDATAATSDTNLSAVHAEESYTGGMGDKDIRKNSRQVDPNVSVSMGGRSIGHNIIISAKREDMTVQVINALLDAYPKGIRVDSEGGRLPLHTACAGRATPRVMSTLVTAYPSAARQRNKDGFLPLHLAAHWGISHPNVAITLLKAYPDATVGRNRWERTPLEEALCMAGENGRPHQAVLVRALRKHPSYWTRPAAELFATVDITNTSSRTASGLTTSMRNQRGGIRGSTAVDVDESLPSSESTTQQDSVLETTMKRYGHDVYLLQGESDNHAEFGLEVGLQPPPPPSPSRGGRGKMSPRSLLGKQPQKVDPNISLATLIQQQKWGAVLARLRESYVEAEQEVEVMTRGGFMAASGMTCLHYACERKPPVQVVNALIEAYPLAVMTRCMPGGCLPLHIACTWYATADVVTSLLSADLLSCKVTDELGNVAIHSACFSGADVAVIEALLSADGNSVLTRNHQGSRPIDICKRLRHDNRRQVMALLTLKKEEVLAQHRRSQSSGTWSDTAKEAAELNESQGTPKRNGPTGFGDRDGDLELDDQAIEVSLQVGDNQELVWI